LILHKKGIRSILIEKESLLETGKQRLEEANELLLQLEESPFTISVGSVKDDEEYYTRREFFTFWKKESKKITKQMTPATWRFNHKALHLRQYYNEFQVININIDLDKCTLCSVCARICPQKCIAIQSGTFSVSMEE